MPILDLSRFRSRYLADADNHTGHTQVLEEFDAEGNLQKSFVLGHEVLAQYDAPNGLVYLLYDGHGSTRQLVDPTGAIVTPAGGVVQVFTYNAYGEALGFDESQAIIALLYSGEWFEVSINRQYLRSRYYDQSTGTFNRLDDFAGNIQDPLSLHKYLYASGDPVQFTDPTGLFSVISVSVGSSIGSALNSITAEAGFNVLQSVENRSAFFENTSIQIALIAFGPTVAIIGQFGDDILDVLRRFKGSLDDGVLYAYRAGTQLGNQAKKVFRDAAREIWEIRTGQRAIWSGLQVHHRIPLEWAHVFPNADPNRIANLIGMGSTDHTLVTNAWNAWRRTLNGRAPSQREVLEQALRIDDEFGHLMTFIG